MEQDHTPIKLKLDEDNSLVFEVRIEGEAPSTAPVYRMVCETGDLALVFRGSPSADGVMFRVPALQGKLKEGSYDSHLEVVIENKLLIPIQFKADFVIPTKVQVESVRVSGSPVELERAPAASAKLLRVEGKHEQKKPVPVVPPAIKQKQSIESKQKQITKEQKKHPTLREMYAKKGEK